MARGTRRGRSRSATAAYTTRASLPRSPRGGKIDVFPQAVRSSSDAREAAVAKHPLYGGFGQLADAHPALRGWLASSIHRDDGRVCGLLQLSDKSGGRDFDESDETNIRELVALTGETLDALRLAAQQPA